MASTTQKVADGLTALVRDNKYQEATDRYYSRDIVSTESMGDPATIRGIDAVNEKMKTFMEQFDVRGTKVDGPFVCGDSFVVEYTLDAANKATGVPMPMHEVALYTVADGKIVEEKFFNHS